MARNTIAMQTDIAPGTIEIIEGFSTAITLPERADLLVAEIIGSVASEEGMYTSIRDARLRHMKRPNDPASYIPARCQTVAVPASYSLHHKGEVGWDTASPPVRIACNSPWLLPLSTPQLWEDFDFAEDDPPGAGRHGLEAPLRFVVEAQAVEANSRSLAEQLQIQGMEAERAVETADGIACSLSGISCWPRLGLDEGGGADEPPIIVESRGMRGEPRYSHWQTVLPLVGAEPLRVEVDDVIFVEPSIDISEEVDTPPRYEIRTTVENQSSV